MPESDGNRPQGGKPPAPVIEVSQADTKLLLAIRTHLSQLVRAAMNETKTGFKKPVEMDQGELLLASASLRALFFDGQKPLLLGWLADHGVDIDVCTVQTNIGLILLSELLPEPGHISEYIAGCVFLPELMEKVPLDTPTQLLIAYQDRKGFEEVLRRGEVWAPTRAQDVEINSGLTHISNVGPMQLLTLTRRIVPLSEWGNVRIGYLKNVPITRRNLLEYVANRLGGVHYDSNRTPRDPTDLAQFRVLASAMDWDDQSLMHAGFVAVGIACVEILFAPGVLKLFHDCDRVLVDRQKRLIERGLAAMEKEAEVDGEEDNPGGVIVPAAGSNQQSL